MSDDFPPEYSEYEQIVRAILVDFQYIEEGLRSYISTCYEMVRQRLKGAVPFKYSYEHTEKDALGTLINKFEQLSDDTVLIRELRDLVRFRNGVAHRGYLLTPGEQKDAEYLRRQISALTAVKERTKPCVFKILGAWDSLNKKREPDA